jgi:1-acyl-sn-glycerol-3-phosphate acyltransferase
VLARDDVARYLRSHPGVSEAETRKRLDDYLDELRTTQRYRFYRALQHPLYPILRKVERITEHVEHPRQAVSSGRVVYVSNHKSHLDYLIEPLVLDDYGVRPPLLAAGINLFGGALGLLHRHVTGAIPIRRNSKDPLYLATLRAYVAEVLETRDLLYYAEGGRSYSGELKPPKTGLLQAALMANRASLSIVPMAIAYDIVLEDRLLSREAVRRRKRPFGQELAEMARHAVGYRSRRSLVTLAHRVHGDVGRLHKVLPTALVSAVMRPRTTRADLVSRLDELLPRLAAHGANLLGANAQAAADEGVERLAERAIVVVDGARVRVRDRLALRYYARSLQHLLRPARRANG